MPLEQTLPVLVARAQKQGWRVLVRGTAPDRIALLDEALWRGSDESFLPHGIAGGPHDRFQPTLLSPAGAAAKVEGFACLMAVDNAPVDPAEVRTLQRTCILFDGHDDTAVAAARDQWRQITAAGCGAKYWAQDNGGWVMRAEKPAG